MCNHHGNKNFSLVWMMIAGLFVLGILLLGGDKLSSSGYLWPILVGVFVVAHIWMMFKGHGGHSEGDGDGKASISGVSETKGKHRHGGCCH